MKTTMILIVAAVAFSSFPMFAHQSQANVQESSSATVSSPHSQAQVNQSGSAAASANRKGASANANGSASGAAATRPDEMRPVSGELVGRLDAKSAKPGDPVIVKTTQRTHTADGVDIPKGSRIFGHVTEVQAHSKNSEESRLGMEFDRAEVKGGQMVAIHSVIESVAPSASAMAAATGTDSADFFGGEPAGGGFAGAGMAGARRGGGLVGGGGGGLAGGAGSLAGAGSVAGNAAGGVTGNMGAGVSSAADSSLRNGGLNAAGALNGSAAGSGMLAPRPTGIPGLMLAGDVSGAASGMLSASRKNVHLDSGTQMVLGISSAVER